MTPKRSPASPSEPSPTPLFDFAADSPESTQPSAPTQAPKRGRRPKATQETEPTPAPKRSRTAKKSPSRPTKKAAADATPQELPPNERPFAVPKNWLWTRLGDVATIYNGNSINAKEKAEKYSTKCAGLSFIATKDVGFDSVIDYENGIYIPQAQTTNFKIAPPNSALLCMEGGSAGRKVGLLEQDVCFGNKLCCFAPLFFDGRYLFNYLQGPDFFAEFKRQLAGLIGGVGTQKLKAIPIPIPPLTEIPRIVALVERLFARLDEAAEIIRETLDASKERRSALLRSAFSGALTAQWREKHGVGLETWRPITLNEICQKITDGTHRSPANTAIGDYLYITAKNIRETGIDLSEITYVSKEAHDEIYSRCNVELGDVLYIKDGATTGIATVNTIKEPFSMLSSVALLKPRYELILSEYLAYCLNSDEIKRAMLSQMSGNAITRLTLRKIQQAQIKICSLAEQEEIVRLLDAAFEKERRVCELAEETAARIETLKKAILARAFRGELGTNDPTDPKPFATAPTT